MNTSKTTETIATFRHFRLASYWFAISLVWGVTKGFVLPSDVLQMVGEGNKGLFLGILYAGSAVISTIFPPIFGHYSDKTGIRKPFMLYSAALIIIGFLCMLITPNTIGFWGYFVGFCIFELGASAIHGVYAAMLPDLIPDAELGKASGVIGLMRLLGEGLGVIIAAINLGRRFEFASMALAIMAGCFVTLAAARANSIRSNSPNQVIPIRDFWASPQYNDFRWVFITRALTEFGRTAIQPFLLYYLIDVVKTYNLFGLKIGDAKSAQAILLLAALISAALSSLTAGVWSDRIGKKKILYGAAFLQTLAPIGILIAPNFSTAVILISLWGFGTGAYMSVDWALGVAVLPSSSSRARDLGIWHISMSVPAIFEFGLGGILDSANKTSAGSGYTILFIVSALAFFWGGVLIRFIRGVR
jgi:MFS family permease